MNCDISVPGFKLDNASGSRECPHCGLEIPPQAPLGLCPACLLDGVIHASDEPRYVGEYELVEYIDHGGMGVVYKARRSGLTDVVALKAILNGELASEAEVIRFRGEVKAARALAHPNVVPVYDSGDDAGIHYFTMKYMAGGSLAEHIHDYREDPRRAGELVATIAMAVHYGHERGILHRDLKPANILLDAEGTPYVADFGLAKHVDKPSGHTRSGFGIGTLHYMSPELAEHGVKTFTEAADVYSLGVILYQLLTGRCPFEGDEAKVIKQVINDAARDPRVFEPRIDPDLATICLRCLEKDPVDRYHSAEELGREIRQYLAGGKIQPTFAIKRMWSWCKRRPWTAALIAESVLLIVIATIAVFSGAAAQEKDRREEVLRANEYAARWVAGTVLFKLSSYHDIVVHAAREFPPELYATLRQREVPRDNGLDAYCDKLGKLHERSNGEEVARQDWFISDKWGTTRARSTKYKSTDYRYDVLGRDFAWRDYFKGAWKLAESRSRSAYISRAILSEPNGNERYVISAPIYDENNEPIGVVLATTDTGTSLGTLKLIDPSDKRHIAMVVAPRDNNRDTRDQPLPDDHVILVHDSLEPGQTAFLKKNAAVGKAVALADMSNPNRGLSQLLLTVPNAVAFDEAFCDPVMDGACEDESGQPRVGRWLAGFAPIGNTGFVAIVETPRDTAAHPNQTLAQRLLLWGALPFMVGTALVGGVLGVVRRRRMRGLGRRTIAITAHNAPAY